MYKGSKYLNENFSLGETLDNRYTVQAVRCFRNGRIVLQLKDNFTGRKGFQEVLGTRILTSRYVIMT